MKNNNKIKISLIYNIIIFVLVLIFTILMFYQIQLFDTGKGNTLDENGFSIFKFFTVDSNILLGISSFILAIYEYRVLKKKRSDIPYWVYLIKYMGTCAVALTFVITLLWLSPSLGKNFYLLYLNSNFVFHLVAPILAFISYTKYEKNDLSFKSTLLCLLPLFSYAIFYVSNLIAHFDNNTVDPKYDFYGFVKGGKGSIVVALILIAMITYIFSFIIFKCNKRKNA